MSIATEIQELTQNTAELNTIRGDIRTALTGKGVSASDHNFADFADDIDNIPSGGGGGLTLIGQMDTRVFCNSNGQVATNSSSPGPYSTFVYALPEASTKRISVLVQKSQLSNRCRAVFLSTNPINEPVPSSGVIATGTYKAIISDSNSSTYRIGAADTNTTVSASYMVLMISSESGTELAPTVYGAVE